MVALFSPGGFVKGIAGGGSREVMIGEWSLNSWVEVFWSCHSIIDGSVVQWAWPDGGSLLQQQALTVTMMRMLRAEAQQWVNDTIKAEVAKANG